MDNEQSGNARESGSEGGRGMEGKAERCDL